MKLYDFRPAPNPRRVRIFMAEKGLDVLVVQVDLGEGEQFSPEFQAKNSRCTVPVLELDDGRHICGANPICLYLEQLHPDPPLLGGDTEEQAIAAMWNERILNEGMDAVSETYRNSHPYFKGRAMSGPDGIEQIPALAERGKLRFGHFVERLDGRLGESRYVAGERFGIADISALVTVLFARTIDFSVSERTPHLRRWHEEVSSRPSVQA